MGQSATNDQGSPGCPNTLIPAVTWNPKKKKKSNAKITVPYDKISIR